MPRWRTAISVIYSDSIILFYFESAPKEGKQKEDDVPGREKKRKIFFNRPTSSLEESGVIWMEIWI